jgi:hypothetical protein
MKILKRIEVIIQGVVTKIWLSRAKFEPENSNFNTTPHYRFGGLECRAAKKISSKLSLTNM